MKIVDLICAPGRTGFYFDDQRAIKSGAGHDGMFYTGDPVTQGFRSVRQPGESISVMLVLEDGQIAWGDCAAVQYSGAGGRDPLFLAEEFIPLIETHIKPVLVGREADSFRDLCRDMEAITIDGKRLHTALRYGLSQAILDAVAKATGRLMCEVVADEYGCTVTETPIPIFTQSGDDRYNNADKMIIKGAQVLPHGLINNVKEKLGLQGKSWRTMWRGSGIGCSPSGWIPTIPPCCIWMCMAPSAPSMETTTIPPWPIIWPSWRSWPSPCTCALKAPWTAIATVRHSWRHWLASRQSWTAGGIRVELVADEWCNTLEDIKLFADHKAGHMVQIKTPDLGGINNTIEAVLYCKAKGIGAYQGGTCNETDRSAQVCVQCAMATQPDQILAKPGMGVDEGYMIVYNEMQRILALRRAKKNLAK